MIVLCNIKLHVSCLSREPRVSFDDVENHAVDGVLGAVVFTQVTL